MFCSRRGRNGSKKIVSEGASTRDRLLYDVRRLHNNASVPRDCHMADPQQAYLHHQATGTL